MPRAPRPDDVYRLRIATEPRLSPDGRLAVVTLQTVAPGFDGYRRAIWLVPTDGSSAARQLTLGAQARPPSALLAGRAGPRLPVRPPRPDRGRAAQSGPAEGSRGLGPGPPPAARRWRGAARDGSAARRRGVRMVAGRVAPGRRQRLAGPRPARRMPAAAASRPARPPAPRRHPTTDSSTGSTTCSTARASPTTASRTSGWSTSRPVPRAA